MRTLSRWNVLAPLVWQAAVAQPWLVQKSAKKLKLPSSGEFQQFSTHASVAFRFKFTPTPEVLSFDKKISFCASVELWWSSITLFSLAFTYCDAETLLFRAELLMSRCRSCKFDLMKGRTFGRNGKLVASCTAFWNSSTDRPPHCNWHYYWHIGSVT